jgi:hypothetical protein
MYSLVSNDTNTFLQSPMVNEAMLVEIQMDVSRFRGMTPMIFSFSSFAVKYCRCSKAQL